MIKSKADYKKYLEADRLNLGQEKTLKNILFDNIG